MATNQSWRFEDLELQDDLSLAQELETGLDLSEIGSGWATDLLTLLQDEHDVHKIPSELPMVDSLIRCVLNAPTAPVLSSKVDCSLTYLNRGQFYVLTVSRQSKSFPIRCVLGVEFAQLRLRNCEAQLWERWSQSNPGKRIVEIDQMSCDGISEVHYPTSTVNTISFASTNNEMVITFKINCLSSEFTEKKHGSRALLLEMGGLTSLNPPGGEKGAPLHLVLDCYMAEEDRIGQHVHKALCLLKVFKDKGADRKQKQEQQKFEKLPPDEAAKYMQYELSTLLGALPLLSPSQTTHSSTPKQEHSPSISHVNSSIDFTPNSPVYNLQPVSVPSTKGCSPESSLLLTASSSELETQQWLTNHRFGPFLSLFSSYCGADLLRLSRKDLMDLCGPADGIRLYNSIHSRCVRTIYVCLGQESVYHAIYLEAMTVAELINKLASKLSVSSSHISSIVHQHTYGIFVRTDDMVVQNMYDEQCFCIEVVKEEQGHLQLILKDPPNLPVNLSITGMTSQRHQSPQL